MTKEKYHKVDSVTYEEFKKFQKIKKKNGPFINVQTSAPIMIRNAVKQVLETLKAYIQYFYWWKRCGTNSEGKIFDPREWRDIDEFENMLYDIFHLIYNDKTQKFETVKDKKRIEPTQKKIIAELRNKQ